MQEGPNWESNIIKPSFSSAAIMKVLSETAPTSCFIGANVILVFLRQIKWRHGDFNSSKTGGTTSHLLTPPVHNVPKFKPNPINPLFQSFSWTKLALDLLAGRMREMRCCLSRILAVALAATGHQSRLYLALIGSPTFFQVSMSRHSRVGTWLLRSNSNVFSSPQGFQINFSKVSKESERGPKYVDVLPFTHQVGITRPNILLFRLLFEVDFGETRDGAEEQLLWVELQTAQFYADDNFFHSLSFRFNNTVHVS